jgi:hypothetical protein
MTADEFAIQVMESWRFGKWRPALGLSPEDTEDCVMAAITDCLEHPRLYRRKPAEVFGRTLRRLANQRRAPEADEYPCIEDDEFFTSED